MQQNDHIIVTERCMNLRTMGRQALKGRWKQAVLVLFVFYICLFGSQIVVFILFGGLTEIMADVEGYLDGPTISFAYVMGNYIVPIVISGALTLGLAMYFITLFRTNQSSVSQVFSGFSFFLKAFCTYFLIGLFVFLWMLPVIFVWVLPMGVIGAMNDFSDEPGTGMMLWMVLCCLVMIVVAVWAYLKYSQTFLILADDPTKGALQCIRESKILMKGNKGKYVLLNLSFIGWYLLLCLAFIVVLMILAGCVGGITAVVVSEDAGLAAFIIIYLFVLMIAGTASLFISAYIRTSQIAFYDILTGRLQPHPEQIEGSIDTGSGGVTETKALTETPKITGETPEQPKAPSRKTPKGPDL